MDVDLLQQSLRDKGLDISLRWHRITLPKGHPLTDDDSRPKAIHFKCDAMKLSNVKLQLHGLYASGNKEHTSFPCGYRMRLVPDIARATTS